MGRHAAPERTPVPRVEVPAYQGPVCPVCGGTPESFDLPIYRCERCAELLHERELVEERTNDTRRAYCTANDHDPDTYETRYDDEEGN